MRSERSLIQTVGREARHLSWPEATSMPDRKTKTARWRRRKSDESRDEQTPLALQRRAWNHPPTRSMSKSVLDIRFLTPA